MSAKSSPDCFCCLEKYNKSTRFRVRCPHYLEDKKTECGFESCRGCVKKYLMGSSAGPHCMNCKKAWDRNHLISTLSRAWVEKKYSIKMKALLFETEKARLSENQVEAGNYKKIKPLEKKSTSINSEIAKLYEQVRHLTRERRVIDRKITQYKNMSLESIEKKRKKFIRKCPDQQCHGFLSNRWKCEICNKTVCSKCLEFKIEPDPDANHAVAEHVCDENDVKTAELLKKDTKPCPSCGEQITKISGCDQMWCTSCKNAWSWRDGVVIHGRVHNPHFYEYQRQINNGVAPRVIGDVPCGGVPPFHYWRQKLYNYYCAAASPHKNQQLYRELMNLHRGVIHFQEIVIRRLQRDIQGVDDNKVMRVLYICNELSEELMKKRLMEKRTQVEKNTSRLQIYQLYNTIATENIANIYNNFDSLASSNPHVEQCLNNIKQARIYVNRELVKISFLWKRSIKLIAPDFGLMANCITSKKRLEDYLHTHPLVTETVNT